MTCEIAVSQELQARESRMLVTFGITGFLGFPTVS
jgi:hypothetical protein